MRPLIGFSRRRASVSAKCDHRLAAFTGRGTVRGRTVVALSAIGDPAGFEAMLRRDGGARRVVPFRGPDHHRWTRQDLADVQQTAERNGASAIITTAKDAVRMPAGRKTGVPVLIARLKLEFAAAEARRLRALIRSHLDS